MLYKLNVEFNSDFVTIEKNEITIGVKSKPINGEANKEIIKKLSKHLGVSTSSVKMRSGYKSKQKIIEIQNLEPWFLLKYKLNQVCIFDLWFFNLGFDFYQKRIWLTLIKYTIDVSQNYWMQTLSW